MKTALSIFVIFGLFACNTSISENTDDHLIETKRTEIASIIEKYKEYGISSLPLSETEVKVMDMGELKMHLERAKKSHEFMEARKNSPEAKLTNQYVEKIKAAASEEDKKVLMEELLEKVIKLRAAASEDNTDKPKIDLL